MQPYLRVLRGETMNPARDLKDAKSEGAQEPAREILTKLEQEVNCDIMLWPHVRGLRMEGIEERISKQC